MGRHRYVIGLNPKLASLEGESGVAILERSGNGATWVLVRVPANKTSRVRTHFRGISHVYDTETEARRVWQLFAR